MQHLRVNLKECKNTLCLFYVTVGYSLLAHPLEYRQRSHWVVLGRQGEDLLSVMNYPTFSHINMITAGLLTPTPPPPPIRDLLKTWTAFV